MMIAIFFDTMMIAILREEISFIADKNFKIIIKYYY
jgi:hypothetical protein